MLSVELTLLKLKLFFSAGSLHAQRELADGQFGAMQFHVEPAVGILEAESATDIIWSFTPGSQYR